MRKIRNSLVWLFMLWKRQLKKPDYILLLAVIAALAAALTVISQGSDGLTQIAVYTDDEGTEAVFRESGEKGSAIKFRFFENENDARNAVTNGGLDAAWLIFGTLEASAEQYVSRGTPMVKVVQREETVFLRLAREKLYATLYPYISKAVYDDFLSDNFDQPDKAEADAFYCGQSKRRDVIEVKFNNSDESTEKLNFMVSPLRGLLAIMIFLCAYSAMLSFKRDRKKGLFERTPPSRSVLFEIAYILTSVLNAGALMLIALIMSGIFTEAVSEIFFLAVYILLCTAFCVILGELTDSISLLGSFMPVLILMMAVLCPVFVNLSFAPLLQLLLPPYHYLMAFRSARQVFYSGLYIIFAIFIYAVILAIKRISLKLKK